ncbi:MAG TPA: ribonuclease P [archaeon]|nr:ribonuclease P [archaeon]
MAERRRSSKPLSQIKIARERIAILIAEAEKADAQFSKRYVRLAKKIGMRYNVRLPPKAKRMFCKYCFAKLTHGWRIKNKVRYTTCKSCGRTVRFPF